MTAEAIAHVHFARLPTDNLSYGSMATLERAAVRLSKFALFYASGTSTPPQPESIWVSRNIKYNERNIQYSIHF